MEEQQESFKVVINLLELPQKDITILINCKYFKSNNYRVGLFKHNVDFNHQYDKINNNL